MVDEHTEEIVTEKGDIVSLRIESGLNQKIEAEARDRGVGKSKVIRDACRELLTGRNRPRRRP